MASDFPNSPTLNQEFTVGSRTWKWDGSAWRLNSGGISLALDDLTNVTVPSPSGGEFLKWNGTAWVNDTIDLATDTAGNYVSSLVAGTGVTLSNNSGEAATPTIAIGQAVGTTDSPSFAGVTATGTFTVQQIREKVIDSSISSNVMSLTYTDGAVYYQATAPSANFTIRLSNLPTDTGYALTFTVFVTQGSTGYLPNALEIAGSPNLPLTIKWAGGSAPTPTSSSGKIDVFTFTLIRRGSPAGWTVLGSANLNY